MIILRWIVLISFFPYDETELNNSASVRGEAALGQSAVFHCDYTPGPTLHGNCMRPEMGSWETSPKSHSQQELETKCVTPESRGILKTQISLHVETSLEPENINCNLF